MVTEIHLDYLERDSRRKAEFFTQDGTIVADFIDGTLRLPISPEKIRVLDYSEPPNERYLRELDYFFGLRPCGRRKQH